jgi:hypothetical protein
VKQIGISYQKWSLVAWLNEQDGNAWVAVRPICDAIGIDPGTQTLKLRHDPRFSCRDIPSTGADGKLYDMLCVPAMQISGWLYGINSKKVNPEVAPKLFEFQQFVTQAIYNAVSGRVDPALNARIDDLLTQVAFLLDENRDLRRELHSIKKQFVDSHNQAVSNSARILPLGHIKN